MTSVLPRHIQPICAFNLLFHFQWDYGNLINHKITEHKITAIMMSGCVTISQIGITFFLVSNGMIKINGVWNLGCKVWMKWPKWFVVYYWGYQTNPVFSLDQNSRSLNPLCILKIHNKQYTRNYWFKFLDINILKSKYNHTTLMRLNFNTTHLYTYIKWQKFPPN